jgi:phosphatidate cytidylyltransferase
MSADTIVLVTLALGFGIGAAAIFAAGLNARLKPQTRDLWGFYRSEFIIVAGLLVPAILGRGIFALALGLFLLRAGFELFRLMRAPARAAVLLLIVALMVALIDGLRASLDGFLWIFVVFATVEIGDAFALLMGKLFGRSHPFPKLSPRKTTEGLLGGLLLGGIASYALCILLLRLPPDAAAALAVLLLAAGLAGDLLTSALKRARGAKDFPPVLARHGGILDIYDSFLFAAPAAFAFRLVSGI